MSNKLSKFKNIKISSIIHDNDDDHLLHRDLLLWYPEIYLDLKSKEKVENENSTIPKKDFRIDEIGNWLLDNHRPFKEDYKNLHHKKSVRLHQKRDTIKKAVNNLFQLKLITISKEIESDRNKSIITKEYSFTDSGIIVSWLLAAYRKKNTENYTICIDMFLSSFIKSFQVWDKISIFEFIKNLLENCNKNKLIAKFIELDKYIGLFIKLTYKEDISSILRDLLAIIVLNKKIYEIFVYTINNLDDSKKNILLLRFKREIESLFENAYHIPETLKNWEIMVYKNNCKSDVITMIGLCPHCGNIPFTVNIFRAFELFWFFGEFYFLVGKNPKFEFNRELLDEIVNNSKTKDEIFIQKELCPECKNNDLKIFFRIQKDTNYDETFIYIDKNMISLKELANKRS